MGYNHSGLLIEERGYYYLYSNVHIQETEDCAVVTHRVFRNTTAYGLPIELMKSKRLVMVSFFVPTDAAFIHLQQVSPYLMHKQTFKVHVKVDINVIK